MSDSMAATAAGMTGRSCSSSNRPTVPLRHTSRPIESKRAHCGIGAPVCDLVSGTKTLPGSGGVFGFCAPHYRSDEEVRIPLKVRIVRKMCLRKFPGCPYVVGYYAYSAPPLFYLFYSVVKLKVPVKQGCIKVPPRSGFCLLLFSPLQPESSPRTRHLAIAQ